MSLGFDILKIINTFFHFLSQEGIKTLAYHTTWITIIATILMIMVGYFNARTPIIREYTLSIHKKNPVTDTLKIAVASDIHL